MLHAQQTKVDSLLSVLKTFPDDTNRVNCLNELASNYSEADAIKMIEAAHEALEIAKRISYEKGIADAYGYLGSGYAEAGNNGKAIECFLEALRIGEKRKDLREVALDLHDIGATYIMEGKFDEGIQYYNRAIEIWKQAGNKKGPVTALYNIGYAYQMLGKDTLAMQYYNEAIGRSREIDHSHPLIFSLVNTSVLHLKYKNYSAALQVLDEALKLATEHHNNIMAEIYGIYGEIYLAKGMPQRALAMTEKGLALAKSDHINLYTLQNYKRLENIYKQLGNLSKAYEFLSSYTVLNDSVKKESNRVSIEQMVHGYEMEKKDIQMAAQVERYESGIFRRNTFIGLLICLFLLAFLLGFLVYNRTKNILSAKQRQLLQYTQTLLEKSAIITSINEELDALKNGGAIADDNMDKFSRILQLKIHTDEEWENFKILFEEVYPRFFSSLRYKHPGITASELRLAAITKLNLSVKEAATMLGISAESVKQSRYRLKKRIGVPENSSLKQVLENYA